MRWLILVCIALTGVCGKGLFAADGALTPAPIASCVQLAPAATGPMLLAQAGAQPAKLDPEIYRPLRKGDAKVLIEALSLLDVKDRQGKKIAAFRRNNKLPAERLAVMMQDVTAILARTHLEELLGRLKGEPDVNKDALAWGYNMAKALEFCFEGRYEAFGGNPAFQESVAEVLNNREILEDLVLGNAIPDIPPGGAPGGPEVPP